MKRHNKGMAKLDKSFIYKIIFIGAVAFFVLNYAVSMSFFQTILRAIRPVLIGLIFALILNLPLTFFQNKVFKKVKSKKLNNALSLGSTVLLVLLFFSLMITLIVPQIIATSSDLIVNVREFAEKNFNDDNEIYTWVMLNIQNYVGDIGESIRALLPDIMNYTGRFLKAIIDMLLGLVLSILILAGRDKLINQFKKLLHYEFAKGKALKLLEAFKLAINKFSKYLGGLVIEAIIFGTAMYIGLSILKVPYAPLIAVIMGFVNLIPVLGAYIGAFISTVLIFAVDPTKALVFLIFSTILQQVEAVTTYPNIVGRNVGLSPFWILTSVIVGGSLFGFIGVFLGVPTVAFIHDYISQLIKLDEQERENEERDNKRKEGSDKDLIEAIEDNNKELIKAKIIVDDN